MTQTTDPASDQQRALTDPDNRPDAMCDVFEEWLSDLQSQTDAAAASETFQQWLDIQSKFYDYSVRNTILIRSQRPDATKVAGYRTWQTHFERQVKKGESAIWIWAPIHAKKCPECGNSPTYCAESDCSYDETPPAEWSKGLVGFRPVPVFDIAQTEGEPLPELETTIYGEGEHLVSALLDAATTLDIDASLVNPAEWNHGTALGICQYRTGEGRPHVAVKDQQCATVAHTLAHEYAHAKLHDPAHDDTERTAREVEAESIAYLVSRYWGLDAANARFYLAAWRDDETEVLQNRLSRISRTANTIITAVDHHLANGGEDTASVSTQVAR
ncbi:DUF955 domain-containing protein [Haladaptatus sp. NG-WS-4]